ncbi:hypothetical protein J6590_009537 [Homalodisca vitripennis]|nr:hypothetical protein J6590_009537 [Homalodisca vitripennis]
MSWGPPTDLGLFPYPEWTSTVYQTPPEKITGLLTDHLQLRYLYGDKTFDSDSFTDNADSVIDNKVKQTLDIRQLLVIALTKCVKGSGLETQIVSIKNSLIENGEGEEDSRAVSKAGGHLIKGGAVCIDFPWIF